MSRGTTSRTCRRRRRSRCRRDRPSLRRRAPAGSPGTSAGPSPGSARSAQPRVGSRTSQTCTPVKRPTSFAMSSKSVGVFQRCQTSNWIPSAGGSPASWISSTASGIEVAIVHCSPPSRWYGSIPTRTPVTLGLGGDRPQAVDDGRPRVVRVAPRAGAGQQDEPARAEWREACDRVADTPRSARPDSPGRRAGAAAGSRGLRAPRPRIRGRSPRRARAARDPRPRPASAPRRRSRPGRPRRSDAGRPRSSTSAS